MYSIKCDRWLKTWVQFARSIKVPSTLKVGDENAPPSPLRVSDSAPCLGGECGAFRLVP